MRLNLLITKFWVCGQDPNKFADDWKSAFLEAVAEYNDYYLASSNAKYRIDYTTALTMYGFKERSLFFINH